MKIPVGPGFVRSGDGAVERPAATRLTDTRSAADPPTTLFELNDEAGAATVELTVSLTTEEFERLADRARTRGVRPEQVLRDLI